MPGEARERRVDAALALARGFEGQNVALAAASRHGRMLKPCLTDMQRKPDRVVVTGVGAITAQGPSADALWGGRRGGRVAIRTVEHLSMDGYRTKLGGEVQEQVAPERDVPPPGRLSASR